MNKNVLVIGGAGYIGSHTVLALQEAGFSPVVYDNFSSGHRDAVFSEYVVEGELADRARLAQAMRDHRIGSVVHFAALIEAGQSVIEPLLFYRNNVASTVSLLEAMQDAGVTRLVFSSTAAVYGNQTEAELLHEDLPVQPINPYGQTKAAVEAMLRDTAAASGLKSIALRYFNASGADARARTGERHDPETHLIPLVLQTAAGEREQITVFGTDYPTEDGSCIRDYIHVSDLARGHVAALEKLLATNEDAGSFTPINLGTGQGYSVRAVIETAKRVTNRSFTVVESDRRPGDPATLVSDPSRAHALLGWRAEHSALDTIITDAWNFMNRGMS
ncbi:UDP-glucose 4-epimerase GalE [Roseobacter sinensis]|uniref:UDP-glucose 4-epimerase n=1 Tax=Roseobacter sinensis TaxID=2931391 RepID=A0ABT3BJN4_9RHOB|nr:UDP-glucose 4-epimerase GalE [Roseobacter sp. WL0113]MCV3273790.1 UDP-glucose 4-epimerase GalE [Roseobacter sp. WL0113]